MGTSTYACRCWPISEEDLQKIVPTELAEFRSTLKKVLAEKPDISETDVMYAVNWDDGYGQAQHALTVVVNEVCRAFHARTGVPLYIAWSGGESDEGADLFPGWCWSCDPLQKTPEALALEKILGHFIEHVGFVEFS